MTEKKLEIARVLMRHGAVKTEAEALAKAEQILASESKGVPLEGDLREMQQDLQDIRDAEVKEGLDEQDLATGVKSAGQELVGLKQQIETLRKDISKQENALKEVESALGQRRKKKE